MSGLLIIIIAIVVLGGGYLLYGRYLAKTWGIDPDAETPAYKYQDGVDYEPADTGVVFGHQFASIAGAGPINGPIQAAMFGWVPVLLWILVGGIFFGAVQDFAAMYASVKNEGRTIGVIVEKYIGRMGKKLFTLFTWLFSILVVAAFADIVASTFKGFSPEGVAVHANGAVATTSVLFIGFAVLLGLFLRFAKQKSWVNTIVAIAMLVVSLILGQYLPMYFSAEFWHIAVFLYIAIASVTPVWILLQPRDYLNSYLLVAMIGAAVIGILVFQPSMNLSAFNGFKVNGQLMFPYLFVTIACGAVSGFHALVSSGSASKQIKSEKHMLPVSFGAMLLESLLAVIALVAVGYASTGGIIPEGMTPPQIFAGAIGSFLVKIGVPEQLSVSLITLAISAFALTSLDSVARIGRMAFQEFFIDSTETEVSGFKKFITNKWTATIVTLAVAFALAKLGYESIWPLFGSANQLLSALSLIACAVFFKKTNRKGEMLWIPMIIMLAVTLTALSMTIYQKAAGLINGVSATVGGDVLQLAFAISLFCLGVTLAIQAIPKLKKEKTETQN